MTDLTVSRTLDSSSLADSFLKASARLWFAVAAIGHWIFVVYVIAHYGTRVWADGAEGLADSRMPTGFVGGDWLGNAAAVSHVLLAIIVIGGGPLQLIPAIREHYPQFHRWLGRTYIGAAVVSATAGLYMLWTRGTVGDVITDIAISIDGLLIYGCAAMALRYAMARKLALHRQWAMRLFLVSSAVWFFRVTLMAWVATTGGIGIEWETFTGPFVYALGFAQYVVPLALLQAYFAAQRSNEPAIKFAVAGVVVAVTVFMTIGVHAATVGMWIPRM